MVLKESASPAIPLVPSQLKPAATLMATAFHEDPFYQFVLPDENRRRQVLPWLFGRELAYGLRYGRVLTTSSLEGVALWIGPQNPTIGMLGSLLTGLFLLPFKLTWRELGRSLRLDRTARSLHQQSVAGRHWHLLGLGVDPSQQGRGVGGALLQPVLASADREGFPCYLETNNGKNLPFYERHGFVVAAQGRGKSTEPLTWAMRREPGT